jgi:TIR domain
MKVFLSWSGKKSGKIAVVFKDWIKLLFEDKIETYLSTEDIQKGSRWFTDISQQLQSTHFGICFVTSANLNSPWLHFEAGALAKQLQTARLCPFLSDIQQTELKGPLSLFQSVSPTKNDIQQLFLSINKSLGKEQVEEKRLSKVFEVTYAYYGSQLRKLAATRA